MQFDMKMFDGVNIVSWFICRVIIKVRRDWKWISGFQDGFGCGVEFWYRRLDISLKSCCRKMVIIYLLSYEGLKFIGR